VFLRHHRHELINESFQRELATLYQPTMQGHPPISPALLALATILQAYSLNIPLHMLVGEGRRARYRGVRKKLFDLRRCAVVHNLHVLARFRSLQTEFSLNESGHT
jgi:hypothetical protein